MKKKTQLKNKATQLISFNKKQINLNGLNHIKAGKESGGYLITEDNIM